MLSVPAVKGVAREKVSWCEEYQGKKAPLIVHLNERFKAERNSDAQNTWHNLSTKGCMHDCMSTCSVMQACKKCSWQEGDNKPHTNKLSSIQQDQKATVGDTTPAMPGHTTGFNTGREKLDTDFQLQIKTLVHEYG